MRPLGLRGRVTFLGARQPVYPEYAPPAPNEQEPKLKGYRGSNVVSVHVTELSRVGSLLDQAGDDDQQTRLDVRGARKETQPSS
jgi:hypothetical protein